MVLPLLFDTDKLHVNYNMKMPCKRCGKLKHGLWYDLGQPDGLCTNCYIIESEERERS
jgi:hypothetical protein